MKKFNELKIDSKFTKINKLKDALLSEMPKKTKFKFGVYSEGMFFYYANHKNLAFELGFFVNKNCGEIFPTERMEDMLSFVDYKKYFSLSKFNKQLNGSIDGLIKEYKF